jgi:flagellar hook-associated protein 1 FlgK
MGFETATRGLLANQKAIDVVGHNVSNIGVSGYTRQRVDLVSMSVNMRYTRYNQNTTPFAGQGVGVYGVSQIRDAFLDKRFREEYADVGYYSATSSILEDMHGALDEIVPANLSRSLEQFMDTWDEMLGASINEVNQAANIQAKAAQMVSVLQQMSAKLDNVWNQQEYSLSLDVDNINTILGQVAELNKSISEQQFNSMDPTSNEMYQPLELMDQRNVLLDQLSEYADIYYETDARGMVKVWMGAKDDKNPPVVVEDTHSRLAIRVNEDDPNFRTVSVFWNETGRDVAFNSGAIRASMDMLNGRGMNMDGKRGETWTQGILYYKDKINIFAREFVSAFNNVIEYVYNNPGDPNDPQNGAAFDPPRYKALFTFDTDSYETAAGIRLSAEWEANSSYLITDLRDKLNNGDADNTYAAKASNVFKKKLDFDEFQGTLNEYILFYSNTRLNNDKAFADSRLKAVTEIADTVLDQIQQVSGVSFDEEGVDMMQYKKAYDAVSRVFTTLDEMLDKLINSTGRVGI